MNFPQKILNNSRFMLYLFYFKKPYKGSAFEEDMPNYSQISNSSLSSRIKAFLSVNTQWYYVDEESNLYGTLEDMVIVCDSEGQFSYFCHGFQNIPYFIFENMSDLIREKVKKYAFSKGESYEELLQEYEQLCQTNNIRIDKKYNLEEFEDYINDHI